MNAMDALYITGLAGIAGYVLVGRVPSVLHIPLLSGSNFIHGIVLVGAILAFAAADGTTARGAGFVAVVLAAANVVGGLLLTERVFALFERGRTSRAARARGKVTGGAAEAPRAGAAGAAPGPAPGVRCGEGHAGAARGASRGDAS